MMQAKRDRDAALLTLLPEMSRKKMKQAKPKRDAAPSTLLPESMIHHIQSFLTGKNAAITSCISKSWYNAWLTRPTLSFDEYDFRNKGFSAFEKISTETMERYRDMNLRIQSFSLHTYSSENEIVSLSQKLTADAIEIGATDLNIDVSLDRPKFVLPPQVLGSETLTRLRLSECRIGEGNVIRCSSLKSLVLKGVRYGSDDILRDILDSLSASIEELSLSCRPNAFAQDDPDRRTASSDHLLGLHKLRRLDLEDADVEESFFNDMASRFPFLKDISFVRCTGYSTIQIASTSLESMRFQQEKALKAEFDVPNIRRFVYKGIGLPSLCFKASSREWESDISIMMLRRYKSSWFMGLKKMLETLRGSRISLTISKHHDVKDWNLMRSRKIVVPDPIIVKKLTIIAASGYYSFLLQGLCSVCRPSFITPESETWTGIRRQLAC